VCCASPKEGGKAKYEQAMLKDGLPTDSDNSISDKEAMYVDEIKRKMIKEIDFLLPGASELTHPMRFEIDADPPKLLATTPVSAEPMQQYWIFYDEEYKYVSSYELSSKMPTDFRLALDTLGQTYWGTPAYSLEGMSRDEVSDMIPDINWDGPEKWEPNPPYSAVVEYRTNGFTGLRTALAFSLNINGEHGPIAAKTRIYVINNDGVIADSIDINGEQTYMHVVTDNGKYLGLLSGRAYPEDGGGGLVQNLRIYDISSRPQLIHEDLDIAVYNGTIWSRGNYVGHAVSSDSVVSGVRNYHLKVYNTATEKVLQGFIPIADYDNRDSIMDDGIYDFRNTQNIKCKWIESSDTSFTSKIARR
jgi:hypothetical protein